MTRAALVGLLIATTPIAVEAKEAPAKASARETSATPHKQSLLRKIGMALRTFNVKTRFEALSIKDEVRATRRDLRDRFVAAVQKAKVNAHRDLAKVFGGRFTRLAARDAAVHDRVMLHFINGRNNLENDAENDLQQIVAGSAGDPNTVHVVQMATLKDPVARRFRIQNGKMEALGKVDGVDFGNPEHAQQFFEWALNAKDAQNNPLFAAKQYDLSLWDHGGAVQGDMYDDTTNHNWTFNQYGKAFPKITAGVHVADMCLAGGIEHISEILAGTTSGQPGAKVFVASEETEPGPGHDYTAAGKALAPSGQDLATQGKDWVKSYISSYSPGGSQGAEAVQMAALDVEGVRNLIPRMRVFAKELVAAAQAGDGASLRQQATATQHFALAGQRDLYDFASRVANSTKRNSLKAAANEITSYLKDKVVIDSELTPGNTQHANAHGLAIWLPTPGSIRKDKKFLAQVASGHAPAAYANFRIASLPSYAQPQRLADQDAYSESSFGKLVPEWAQFTNLLR